MRYVIREIKEAYVYIKGRAIVKKITKRSRDL